MKETKRKTTNIKLAIFLPLLALGVSSVATSCGVGTEIVGIHMAKEETINVYYGNFDYTGIDITLEYRDGSTKDIPLAEDMISEVEQLKFFKMGEQKVEVVYRNRFKTLMPIDVLLNKFKDSYALVGYDCVYDGQPHVVTINQELPEGAVITYPSGNIFTNAGTYEVVGVMSKNGYETKTLTTTLNIFQAERDASGIVFQDTTLVYNGEMRAIEALNVPEGVEVTYDTYDYNTRFRINKVVNAGKYLVVAHFEDVSPNYAKIPDKEAILTIEKAHYDLSNISLDDATVPYDGNEYEAKLTNAQLLPSGVEAKIDYYDENNHLVTNHANAGTYKMVATFSVKNQTDNYYPIEPMTATLTVAQRIVKISDSVQFNSATVSFEEGVVHSLAATGFPTDKVQVTYENNDQYYAGEYEVIAHFSAIDPNEAVDLEEMKAYLVINRVRRTVKVFNEASEAEYKYDKPFSSENIVIADGEASVVGIDTEVFKLATLTFTYTDDLGDTRRVAVNEMVNGKTYQYVAVFEYLDERMNDSVILSQESDNFTYIVS